MKPDKTKLSIIFVCLGNYCRSPMAEAIFKTKVNDAGLADRFEISSAGTKDWDIGLPPDRRAQEQLQIHDYPLNPHKRARKITNSEIQETDYLIAMSERVANALSHAKNVHLLLDFCPEITQKDIPDPYPTNTFPKAFSLIEKGCAALLDQIKQDHKLNE